MSLTWSASDNVINFSEEIKYKINKAIQRKKIRHKKIETRAINKKYHKLNKNENLHKKTSTKFYPKKYLTFTTRLSLFSFPSFLFCFSF